MCVCVCVCGESFKVSDVASSLTEQLARVRRGYFSCGMSLTTVGGISRHKRASVLARMAHLTTLIQRDSAFSSSICITLFADGSYAMPATQLVGESSSISGQF